MHLKKYFIPAIYFLLLLFQVQYAEAEQINISGKNHSHFSADTIITGKDSLAANEKHQLKKSNNIVFLLDVSNSMGKDNKMHLLHKSMHVLLLSLRRVDRIHLITFGNTVNQVYSTTSLTTPDSLSRILEKIRSTASATNVNGGIQTAYENVLQHFIKNGNNEVMLITDGEFLLNRYTIELVKTHTEIRMTCVIVGKGPDSKNAVEYVKRTLKLPVVTLIDESLDTEQLLDYIKKNE